MCYMLLDKVCEDVSEMLSGGGSWGRRASMKKRKRKREQINVDISSSETHGPMIDNFMVCWCSRS